MKQSMMEYQRTRRQIRKVNREARVDQYQTRRTAVKIILIIFACLFAVVEVFGITYAKKLHDRETAKELAEAATIELSLINASLITSDQTQLKDHYQQYQNTLVDFNKNSFMQTEHQALLEELNNYDATISREVKDAHLIKLHTAITMLEQELQGVDLSKVSNQSLNSIKENFEDFRDSLENLDDERFTTTIAELTDYSDKLIKLIDKTSVCVGTCSKKTFTSRQNDLTKIFEESKEKLSACDIEISRHFSPAELVESLKVLQ